MSAQSSERLAQLFERELRGAEPVAHADRPRVPTTPRISQELEAQVAVFVEETRSRLGTPERMLVELKRLLADIALDVPRSRRSELVSKLTGRAIDVFFGR